MWLIKWYFTALLQFGFSASMLILFIVIGMGIVARMKQLIRWSSNRS